MKFASAFLLCSLTIGAAAAANAQSASLTPEKWREDLTYLVGTMKSVHPAPFHRVPEAEMDRAVQSLARDIPTLSDQVIAIRMVGVVALLNDGHCRLNPAPILKRERAFPVRIERFADGIYVVAARPEQQQLAGARVLNIGPRSAAAALDSVMVIASGDNVYSRMSGVPLFLTLPDVMSALGLASADSLILTVQRGAEKPARVAIAAVQAGPDASWIDSGWNGPGGAVAAPVSHAVENLVELHRTSPYWFTQSGTMLYAQINQVANVRDTVPLGESRGVVTLDDLARMLVERVERGGVDKLVLDLRFNGGGNNVLAKAFVQRLSASKAVNQSGKLFVITGRETYSAAMNFTSLLEDRTAAIFVGEAPGGTPIHYGDNTAFTLPNSKMTFRISTLHWDMGVGPSDVRVVMEPHLPAPPTLSDYLAGRDAPLATIARYRDGDRLADRLLARYKEAGLDSAMALYDAGARARPMEAPWRSDVQQLLKFATSVIANAKARADIFRAFSMVTDRYPDSPEAWSERARVNAFVNDWPEVLKAYTRAHELLPQDDYLRRQLEAARRR